MNGRKFKIPYIFITLTLGIVLGIQIQKIFSDDTLMNGIRKLNDVLTFTEKYYIEEVDTQKLVDSAVEGIMDNLDPHSVYISPEQLSSVEESFRGDFEGIGIEFQVVNDTLIVVSPISGGPSEALGILSGDRIIKIENEDCIGITNEQVRQKLRGEAGTKVKVTIYRQGVSGLLDYEITRDKIPIYSLDTHLMLDDKTGYVSVSRFSETTYSELEDALKNLKQSGMTQLILDLRGNPGGYLSQAVEIADLFIEGKKKIVYTKGRRAEFNEEFFAEKTSDYENIPLVILLNRGSASASEIVAGAVQDWDRGLIVGETSFGKGLVQRQFNLPDNSAIRLTISEYFTPSGRLIQRDYKGVKDKEEYYSDLMEREEEQEGDNLEHTAEHDSSKPEYKTDGGRIVYGGGGITPDYIIQTNDLTEYTTELLRQNVFYQFILKYLSSHSDLNLKYDNDLNKFKQEFFFSDADIENFKTFAAEKNVEFKKEDFEKEKDYILTRLKAQLGRNFWKNEGWYTILLGTDNQLSKAVTLFDEAKNLANLK
jgi:carboxyl-terminal processing protease